VGKDGGESLKKFIQGRKIGFPFALDEQNRFLKSLGSINAITMMLVKDGVVVWNGNPMLLTTELIESWLHQ
jgi:hypothetical protein